LAVLAAVAVLAAGAAMQARAGDVSDALRAYWDFDTFTTVVGDFDATPVPHEAQMKPDTKGTYEDITGKGHTMYVGSTYLDDVVPFDGTGGMLGGGAFFADNNGNNNNGCVGISLDSGDFDFGGGAFTISVWQKNEQFRSDMWDEKPLNYRHRGTVISRFNADHLNEGTDAAGWRLGYNGGNFGLTRGSGNSGDAGRGTNLVVVRKGLPSDTTLYNGNPPMDGMFAHMVVSYTPADGMLRVYLNGDEFLSTAMDASTVAYDPARIDTDQWLTIGAPSLYGVTTTSFGFQAQISGLSSGLNNAWIDDLGLLATGFTPAEAKATHSLGTNAELRYDLGDVVGLLDVHRAAAGSVDVGGLSWTYATGLAGTEGEVTGSGTEFTLVLDPSGSGLVSGAATPDLPGDANLDGYADDTDLAVLLGNWEQDAGTITTWALGDFTADTDVDDDDLAVLLGNWTGPPPGGAAVPEPATLALLGLGGLSVLRRRRS